MIEDVAGLDETSVDVVSIPLASGQQLTTSDQRFNLMHRNVKEAKDPSSSAMLTTPDAINTRSEWTRSASLQNPYRLPRSKQSTNTPSTSVPRETTAEMDPYIKILAAKIKDKPFMMNSWKGNKRKRVLPEHVDVIRQRLSTHPTACDLDAFICGYGLCGRTFESISGKVAHLVSRHRDLCQAHNQQCVDQREMVIAPNAPAALRLEEIHAAYMEMEEEDPMEYVIVQDHGEDTVLREEEYVAEIVEETNRKAQNLRQYN